VFEEINKTGKLRFKFLDKSEIIDACQGFAYSLPYFDESNVELLVQSDYFANEF